MLVVFPRVQEGNGEEEGDELGGPGKRRMVLGGESLWWWGFSTQDRSADTLQSAFLVGSQGNLISS